MKKEIVYIHWGFILNTNKLHKAKRIEKQILSFFSDIESRKLDVYWKDEKCYELSFKQKTNISSEPDFVLHFLKKIYNLSSNWNVTLSDNLILDFSGYTEYISITGVVWSSFMVG